VREEPSQLEERSVLNHANISFGFPECGGDGGIIKIFDKSHENDLLVVWLESQDCPTHRQAVVAGQGFGLGVGPALVRGRLELDAPAVTLVDLVLSKLQIHEITDNDLLDLIVLLAEHDLGDGRNRTIDMPRLLAVTSQDWGLYHTASLNLLQVLAALERLEGLPAATAAAVRSRIAELQARMEVEPKSRRWRLRAALGTRVQWYQDVDEVERGA